MYIKYEVPEYRREFLGKEKILYGKIIQKQYLKHVGITLYKVQFINFYDMTDILNADETKRVTLIDKIKIFLIKIKRR